MQWVFQGGVKCAAYNYVCAFVELVKVCSSEVQHPQVSLIDRELQVGQEDGSTSEYT